MHHIELYVSDLEASRRFWGWFLKELGFKEYQKWSLRHQLEERSFLPSDCAGERVISRAEIP